MLDEDDVRSCYFNARAVFDDFLDNELYTYSKTPTEHLTYFNYINYCKVKYEFDFVPYKFNLLGNYVGGNLQVHQNDVVITYNENNNVPRQHFTKLHEISHYFIHYRNGIKGRSFSQSIRSDSLSYEDLILEQEADFGASFMQIHDDGLERCFRSNMSFNYICHEFSMSYASLHTRIMTFLVFEKELSQNAALKLTNGYRYANKLNNLKQII